MIKIYMIVLDQIKNNKIKNLIVNKIMMMILLKVMRAMMKIKMIKKYL